MPNPRIAAPVSGRKSRGAAVRALLKWVGIPAAILVLQLWVFPHLVCNHWNTQCLQHERSWGGAITWLILYGIALVVRHNLRNARKVTGYKAEWGAKNFRPKVFYGAEGVAYGALALDFESRQFAMYGPGGYRLYPASALLSWQWRWQDNNSRRSVTRFYEHWVDLNVSDSQHPLYRVDIAGLATQEQSPKARHLIAHLETFTH